MANLDKYKANNYADLLNLEQVANLDTVLEDIKAFVKPYVPKKDNAQKGVSTSQLRNIYDKVRSYGSSGTVAKLKLLRPKLAYVAARNKDAKGFIDVLDSIVKEVTTTDDLKGFIIFFESVVAYHKYYSEFPDDNNITKNTQK